MAVKAATPANATGMMWPMLELFFIGAFFIMLTPCDVNGYAGHCDEYDRYLLLVNISKSC